MQPKYIEKINSFLESRLKRGVPRGGVWVNQVDPVIATAHTIGRDARL